MGQGLKMAAMGQLRIRPARRAISHPVGGHPGRLEQGLNYVCPAGDGPRHHRLIQLPATSLSALGSGQGGGLAQILPAHGGGQCLPLLVGGAGNGHPHVVPVGGVHPMRRVVGVVVADPHRHDPRQLIIKHGGGQQPQRGLGLRHIEVAAPTCAPPFLEGGENGAEGEPGGHHVGVGQVGTHRSPVGPTANLIEPRDGGGEVAKPGELRQRAALAHQAGADQDQGRVHLGQGGPIQTQVAGRPGAVVDHRHIGPADEILQHRAGLRVGQI